MDLSPIWNAPVAIQIHIAAALIAFALLIAILVFRRGGRLHRAVGKIWVCAMIVTATSSFWISTINHIMGFSAIHLLSIYTLISCAIGVRAIRRKDVRTHRKAMLNTAFSGLFIAGAFSFLPGRIMNQVLQSLTF